MDGGTQAFDIVPLILKRVIEGRLWFGRKDEDGQPFSSFEAFVTYVLPQGLESSIDDLRAYCRKRPEVDRLIRAEVDPEPAHGRHGRGRPAPNRVDNVNSKGGNKSTYALKRLKRDRPDLFRKVVDGKLSANAAAIEAGFRRKTFTVPADVDGAAQALRRRFSDTECRALAGLLQ